MSIDAMKQEPVAWMQSDEVHISLWKDDYHNIPLYTTPPAAPVQEADAYGHAKRLAEAIWQKHYKATAPQWKPFDDLIGVLTQIDNMTAGLTAQPAQRKPLTDEQIESGRRVLSCFDFDLFMAGARFAEAAHGIKEKNT